MKRIFAFVCILAVVVVPILAQPIHANAATPFNPNDLIDDQVFENTSTMSPTDIDTWLNTNFGSTSCIGPNANGNGNPGFRAADPQGWSDTLGHYAFGGNVTAGQEIYDAAQLYHLNPQVILTTLQKEQSLVIGGAGCYYATPDPSTAVNSPCGSAKTPCTPACPYSGGCINIGMSYACPNYCAASDESFPLQLTLGSWLLRFSEERAYGILNGYQGYETGDENFTYSGPMTAGWRQRSAGGASVYYDGSYTTSDGTSVTISNGATASLYTYTPFISGNLSFDNLFQGPISNGDLGFGSVIANDSLTPHPNGTLVSSGGRVYLINNNTKQWVAGGEVFDSQGYTWLEVKTGTTGDANLPSGPDINNYPAGFTFRTSNSPVYVMTYQGGNLVKQPLSYQSFLSLGYNWDRVRLIDPSSVPSATNTTPITGNLHPAGSLIVDQSTGKVYQMDQTTKHWILGGAAFLSNNFNWNDIMPATSADMAVPDGTPLDIRQGTLLTASGNIYVVEYDSGGILKQPVGPYECFANRWHYTLNDPFPMNAADLPARTGGLATC